MKHHARPLIVFAVSLAACLLGTSAATAQVPEEGRKALEYYVGEWQYEWEVKGTKYNGTWSVRWSPDESCTLSHWSSTGPEGPAKGTIVTGWDNSKNQMVSIEFSDTGEHMLSRYTCPSDKLEVGDGTGSTKDGKASSVKFRTNKKPDEFTWILTDRVEGDEQKPDLEFVFRRVKTE